MTTPASPTDSLPPSISQAHERAFAAFKAGNLAEAEVLYRSVPAADGKYSVALNMRGVIQGLRGDLVGAKQMISDALALEPDFAVGWHNLGIVLKRLGCLEQALASYDRALALAPGFAEALASRGIVLCDLGRFEEALASLERSSKIKPDFAEAHVNRGLALLTLKRFEEAVAANDEALAIDCSHAQAYSNRGIALCEIERCEEAVASFDRGLAVTPRYAEAWSNRGVALFKLRQFDEALASYAQALAIDPGYAEAHYNEAYLRLLTGDFERGWAKYEWRGKLKGAPVMPDFGKPPWLGEPDLAGKTILLLGEQGFGDVIQFCRYAPMLNTRGSKVILAVSTRLKSLLGSLGGASQILGSKDTLPEFDFYARLMSMPLVFKTRIDSIPPTVPYLRASDAGLQKWRGRVAPGTRPKVGIAWAGSRNNDRNRSISLRDVLPMLAQTGVQLFSLQKDLRDGDAEFLRDFGQVTHLGGELEDFDDTAAIVSRLDLVVSVDTSLAHLAGALGKPVWILLPFLPDWRWLLDREDSPWYPTARLFRQQRVGDWKSVIMRVAVALSAM